MSCATCIHFLSRGAIDATAEPSLRGAEDIGLCRRYPPRLSEPSWDEMNGLSAATMFPQVHKNHACGEYAGSEIHALLEQSERYRRPEDPIC